METDIPQTLAELIESDFIKCKVCLRPLTQAKILPCLDTICAKCISSILKTLPDEHSNFACPICYETARCHVDKLADYTSNIFLEDLAELAECKNEETKYCDYCNYIGHKVVATGWCLDCKDNLCTTCTGAHQKTKVTRSHVVAPFKEIKNHRYDHDIRQTQSICCNEHSEHILNEYCLTCNELVCLECVGNNHKEHKTAAIRSAAENFTNQLSSLADTVNAKDPMVVKHLDTMKKYIDDISKREKRIEEAVKCHVEALHRLIDDQCERALETLHNQLTNEICDVENKMKKMTQTLTALRNNGMFIKMLQEHGKSEEKLYIQKVLLERLTKLVYLDFDTDGLTSTLEVDFQPGNNTQQNIEVIFGHVHSKINAVPGATSNHGKIPHGSAPHGLVISTVLPTLSNVVELVVEFEASSSYDEKDIWPTGLAITVNNEHVVVDRENKRVKIIDVDGNHIRDFTGDGTHNLGCPFDAAVMRNGNIAVTDYESEEVKVFNTQGKYVTAISGYFKHPRGITVNSKGEIIVVDCSTLQVTIHNPDDGSLVQTIKGHDEEGFDFFSDPYYVAVTKEDNIIVTDWAAPNIKVFSPDGKFLAKYGTYGIKQDQVLEPYGVCTDAFGYIFVADNQNHRIHLLLPDGRFQKFLLSKINGIWHPMAISINHNGHLVITEALGKVRVYKYI